MSVENDRDSDLEDSNLAASNRALELLGKHLGLWGERPKAGSVTSTESAGFTGQSWSHAK